MFDVKPATCSMTWHVSPSHVVFMWILPVGMSLFRSFRRHLNAALYCILMAFMPAGEPWELELCHTHSFLLYFRHLSRFESLNYWLKVVFVDLNSNHNYVAHKVKIVLISHEINECNVSSLSNTYLKIILLVHPLILLDHTVPLGSFFTCLCL